MLAVFVLLSITSKIIPYIDLFEKETALRWGPTTEFRGRINYDEPIPVQDRNALISAYQCSDLQKGKSCNLQNPARSCPNLHLQKPAKGPANCRSEPAM
jgi:hypothetical protein